MRAFGVIAIILAAVAAAQEELPVQPRLRGSKPRDVMPTSTNHTIISRHSSADDESSCSSEGITPGVCALASLARSAASKTTSPRNHVDEYDGGAGGLLVHTSASDKLERALLAEIESALEGNHTGFDISELRQLEQQLLPIFASLPHEQYSANGSQSSIGFPAARYLLHEHFVRQHSWYVRGLNPVGDEQTDIPLPPVQYTLRSHMAGRLLKVMQDKVGQKGFDLKMLAIFVATLKHLLHGDQQESLKQVWSLQGLQPDDIVDAQKVGDLLEVFIAHHVYTYDGYNFDGEDKGFVPSMEMGKKEVEELREVYTGWPKIMAFIEKEVRGDGKKLKFQDASLMADRVLEYFRKVSGSMCHEMEQKMRSFEGGEQGRVKLSHLRALQGNGEDLVDETLQYLDQLGALDGSTEDDAYVFVPNYMLGPSNCDMTTSFYDLCCPNPCDVHKEHLERALLSAKSDRASAIAVITEIVQQHLGSALPVDMSKTLDIIAAAHEDRIPIHSRAFADWLHEVFPRDCPRTRAKDFSGVAGDLLPDANREFSV